MSKEINRNQNKKKIHILNIIALTTLIIIVIIINVVWKSDSTCDQKISLILFTCAIETKCLLFLDNRINEEKSKAKGESGEK